MTKSLIKKRQVPFRCIGIFGRIFGHKMTCWDGPTKIALAHCERCSMPMGGWQCDKTNA